MERGTPRRIKGSERMRLGKQLAREYKRGQSIRQLAKKHGLSYGVVYRLLIEQGVELRPRGGVNRGRKT